MVRYEPFQGCNARFEPGADHHFASDIYVGHKTLGYSQRVKAPVFDTGTVGSNPTVPAMIRYSKGQEDSLQNCYRRFESGPYLHMVPSSSRSGRQPLRLAKSRLRRLLACIALRRLSSWKYGFESRRDHQSFRHIGIDNITTV